MKSGYWTREFIAGLFHLITPYWNSEEKKSARLYLAGIITLTIAAVYMTLLLNEWFNSFYSALQNYDSGAVYRGLLRFTGLAFAHIAFAVYSYYLQQRLALRWRKWMTKNYLAKWTGRQMYYRLEMFSQGTADNPDQRISEDINLFTARTLSFIADCSARQRLSCALSLFSGIYRKSCRFLPQDRKFIFTATLSGRRSPTPFSAHGSPIKSATASFPSITSSKNWKPTSVSPWSVSVKRRKAWHFITARQKKNPSCQTVS